MSKNVNTQKISVNIDKYLYKNFKLKTIELDTTLTKTITETMHKIVSSSNISTVSGSI